MISIKKISYEDTDDIVRWRNSELVRKNFIFREFFTREIHENWMRTQVDTGKVVQFIIYENDRKVGSVYLRDIDKKNDKAEFGIFIGEEDCLGRGIGPESARLILNYGFDELKLNKIYLRVLAKNIRAIKSYEKIGFINEGIHRQDVILDDKAQDVIFMSILKEEW